MASRCREGRSVCVDNARCGFLQKSTAIVPVAALDSATYIQQTSTTTASPPNVSLPSGHYRPVYFNAYVVSPSALGWQAPMLPRGIYRASIAAADACCKSAFSGKTFSQMVTAKQHNLLKSFESGEVKSNSVPSKTVLTCP